MVVKMRESGFCFGARRAVDKALQYEGVQRQVVLLGNIVNNEKVVQNFINKGFLVFEDASLIPENAIVIIRAHGVSRKVYDELKKKNVVIEDCTCIKVAKIHEIVYQKSYNDYKIIIVGKRDHPEVIGTLGWCYPNSGFVVENESDLEEIDLSSKICVVAQTTCSKELWEDVTCSMLKKNDSIEVYGTLCDVMRNRERKAKEIAMVSDTMIVIGDNSSSNSRELYKKCCAVCKNTFFISSLVDIESNPKIKNSIIHSSNVGVAGSASAPDEVIEDIYNYLLFLDFQKEAKKEIEDYTCKCFKELSLNARDNSFIYESLDTLEYQNGGGKRLRGVMIKLGEQIASHGKNNNYLPIAVGYELFQTAILVHDDIIDEGNIRRGKETIHINSAKTLKRNFADKISDDRANHYGLSRALCIGDYGFFISYQFLSKCNLDHSIMVKIYQLYSQILTLTCEGEIMDTLLPFNKISVLDRYDEYRNTIFRIYEYKTAWYTLAGPIMLGALCGGAKDELVAILKDIAIPLGIAFQIKDDLLGIYSDEEVLGKTILSDIREDKQTLLFGIAYKNANKEQKLFLDNHYGKKNANKDDLQKIRNLFEETGAKEYAESEIQKLAGCSKKLIHNDLISEEYQSILYGLVNYLVDRNI